MRAADWVTLVASVAGAIFAGAGLLIMWSQLTKARDGAGGRGLKLGASTPSGVRFENGVEIQGEVELQLVLRGPAVWYDVTAYLMFDEGGYDHQIVDRMPRFDNTMGTVTRTVSLTVAQQLDCWFAVKWLEPHREGLRTQAARLRVREANYEQPQRVQIFRWHRTGKLRKSLRELLPGPTRPVAIGGWKDTPQADWDENWVPGMPGQRCL